MTTNNNLSVLPWYGSIDDQNARKWWIYDRIYPLFTPARFLLPFQIMRKPLRNPMPDGDYDSGYCPSDSGGAQAAPGCGITVYDIDGVSTVLLYDIPAAPSGAFVMANAEDADGNLLGVFNPVIGGTYTGEWDLPEGTAKITVLTYNSAVSEVSGIVSDYSQPCAEIVYAGLYKSDGTFVGDCTQGLKDAGLAYKGFHGFDVIVFFGGLPVWDSLDEGQYYLVMQDAQNEWFSEVFTAVADMSPYLKLEWWDEQDFVMDAGTIVYDNDGRHFRNVLYLKADIAKPEYIFEEEGESRDGYFFPVKQISEKRYRFAFLASEYLLDVLRFVRMADYAVITKAGKEYTLDTFLISPEWEDNGDVAAVEAEFETDTVAKKIGATTGARSYRDFNNDFNNDFK